MSKAHIADEGDVHKHTQGCDTKQLIVLLPVIFPFCACNVLIVKITARKYHLAAVAESFDSEKCFYFHSKLVVVDHRLCMAI